ncbi:tctex1 domain-containing protein 2-like [Selaginella moellendorffii]|uniref:tctex1 domain-containing protein 2-like n=1 Tax=Selaginella moellendorffii TaxID=88036 RepID=UPI000D1C5AC9|nr:tctex1 domain-containing protein 2-like [Selaginella moellendorffii]|eukprot:XP_024544834.1 tctex1 domain-containing protein 2-like [Selaginella moellendorffii]
MEKVLEKLAVLHEGEDKHTRVVVQSKLPYIPKKSFLPGKVKEVINEVLREKLTGVQYDGEQAPYLVREIADEVKNRCKGKFQDHTCAFDPPECGVLPELHFERYKIVVQAVIGETRGQGLQMAARCFWDKDTDDYTRDTFQNDNMFGIAAVFGLYMY